jgi:hypothetical protein
MKYKSRRTFIKEHKPMLLQYIKDKIKRQPSEREIELWILNDESLYLWAKSEKVDI